MRRRATGLAALALAALIDAQAGVASASTAETQARLAKARPVATQSLPSPPRPVTADQPPARQEPLAAPPKPDFPPTEAFAPRAAPRPAPRHDAGLILLIPALIALVAFVRWFARRRRPASKRV